MADQTGISWCDATHNEWLGCANVSPGCDHCYAEALVETRFGRAKWGPKEPRVLTSAANRRKPLAWNRQEFVECANEACGWRGELRAFKRVDPFGFEHTMCPNCGSQDWCEARRRVFSASLSDWLDNAAPAEWLAGLLRTIALTPELDWLLLSKRIGNWRTRLQAVVDLERAGSHEGHILAHRWLRASNPGDVPANVWLGATVVNQEEADRDIPKLLQVPARVRFLSIEPMLGEVSLQSWIGECERCYGRGQVPSDKLCARCWSYGCEMMDCPECGGRDPDKRGLDWIIGGFESGHGARPGHPAWARVLRDQCAAAGVPFLWKQNGEWAPLDAMRVDGEQVISTTARRFVHDDGQAVYRFGAKASGRLLDGCVHAGFPGVANG